MRRWMTLVRIDSLSLVKTKCLSSVKINSLSSVEIYSLSSAEINRLSLVETNTLWSVETINLSLVKINCNEQVWLSKMRRWMTLVRIDSLSLVEINSSENLVFVNEPQSLVWRTPFKNNFCSCRIDCPGQEDEPFSHKMKSGNRSEDIDAHFFIHAVYILDGTPNFEPLKRPAFKILSGKFKRHRTIGTGDFCHEFGVYLRSLGSSGCGIRTISCW